MHCVGRRAHPPGTIRSAYRDVTNHSMPARGSPVWENTTPHRLQMQLPGNMVSINNSSRGMLPRPWTGQCVPTPWTGCVHQCALQLGRDCHSALDCVGPYKSTSATHGESRRTSTDCTEHTGKKAKRECWQEQSAWHILPLSVWFVHSVVNPLFCSGDQHSLQPSRDCPGNCLRPRWGLYSLRPQPWEVSR
jgi:hypothetical protein